MEIPDTLTWKIEHFRRYGRLLARDADLFGVPSWLALHVGQGNIPEGTEPLLHHRSSDQLEWMKKLEAALAHAAEGMPTHQQWIDKFCQVEPA